MKQESGIVGDTKVVKMLVFVLSAEDFLHKKEHHIVLVSRLPHCYSANAK